MKSKKIATYGLLIALAFILSYIETLLPIPLPVPGMKLGLANLVVITALYLWGSKEAFVLSIVRIVLVGFTFGNLSTLMFSLSGGILSCILMILAKKIKLFGIAGVSIVGGVSHNIGQIIVAIFIINNIDIIYYIPILMIVGAVTGTIIGVLSSIVTSRIKKVNDW